VALGRWTIDADIDRVLEVLPGIITRLRAMSPMWGKSQIPGSKSNTNPKSQ
jgi:cysteine desulfurase